MKLWLWSVVRRRGTWCSESMWNGVWPGQGVSIEQEYEGRNGVNCGLGMAGQNIPGKEMPCAMCISQCCCSDKWPSYLSSLHHKDSSLAYVTGRLWVDCSPAWAMTLLLVQELKLSFSVGHAVLVAERKIQSIGGNSPWLWKLLLGCSLVVSAYILFDENGLLRVSKSTGRGHRSLRSRDQGQSPKPMGQGCIVLDTGDIVRYMAWAGTWSFYREGGGNE